MTRNLLTLVGRTILVDPHLEDSRSFVPVLWQLHRPTLWALSQPLQFGGCYSGHPEMASPPSHLTVSLPVPQVSCPSAPMPPWAKLLYAHLSQAPQGLPGSWPAPCGPKAVLPREGPSPPCSFLGPSSQSHSECCVRSPYFCFSALCTGWAEGSSPWTSSPSAGWFPRSHLAQTGHGRPAPGQQS